MPVQKKSSFSFSFSGLVWKVLAETRVPAVVLEVRKGETRKVEFAAIDILNGKLLWEGSPAEENWWLGLKQLKDGLAILQGYTEVQKPEPIGIWVVEIQSGKLLWKNESASFVGSEGNTLILKEQQDEGNYLKVNLLSGKVVENASEPVIPAGNGEELNHDVKVSGHYTAENPHFSKLAQFVKIIANADPVKAIDYLEVNNYIIISFYIYNNGKLTNEILVSDEEGQVLLREQIGEELPGIGLETFFVISNRLVFIRNKKELLIYEL